MLGEATYVTKKLILFALLSAERSGVRFGAARRGACGPPRACLCTWRLRVVGRGTPPELVLYGGAVVGYGCERDCAGATEGDAAWCRGSAGVAVCRGQADGVAGVRISRTPTHAIANEVRPPSAGIVPRMIFTAVGNVLL